MKNYFNTLFRLIKRPFKGEEALWFRDSLILAFQLWVLAVIPVLAAFYVTIMFLSVILYNHSFQDYVDFTVVYWEAFICRGLKFHVLLIAVFFIYAATRKIKDE